MTNLNVKINEGINLVEERNNLVDRFEVLERVKGLLLLPNMEVATTQQVADFYGVELNTIKMNVVNHREELETDGYYLEGGKQIKEILESQINCLPKIISKKGHFTVNTEGRDEIKISYGKVALFTRRAILRIGMLLRDSEIAKEVRTQLLNIEEKASEEVKTEDILTEEKLMLDCYKAMQSGDMLGIVQANKKLNEYQNRFIKEKADKYDHYLTSDGTISIQEFGKRFLGGLSSQKTRERMQAREMLFKKKTRGAYLPRKGYEKYFKVTEEYLEDRCIWVGQTRVTKKGIDFLIEELV